MAEINLGKVVGSDANVTKVNVESALGYTPASIQQFNDILDVLPDNAGSHNSIYRGKNLGSSVTPEQYANISNGSFKDMYIGDYWSIGGVIYRIAGFNYYKNTGDVNITSNHVTLVPDTILYTHVMNDINTTKGGYMGSKLYSEGLEQAKNTINSAFTGHVMKHRLYLSNAVVDSKASGGTWVHSEVDLMNETMVYGAIINGSGISGVHNVGLRNTQLPLFMFRPDLIKTRESYWLSDVVSDESFAFVFNLGSAHRHYASYEYGVRPSFTIL